MKFTKETKGSLKLDLKEIISDYKLRNSKPISPLLDFDVYHFSNSDQSNLVLYNNKINVNNIWSNIETNAIDIQNDLLEKAFEALDFLWFKNIENFSNKNPETIKETKTKISDFKNDDKNWKESSINLIKEITNFISDFCDVESKKYNDKEYSFKLIFSEELNTILKTFAKEDAILKFLYLIELKKIQFISSNFLNKEHKNVFLKEDWSEKKFRGYWSHKVKLNLKKIHALMFLFNEKESRWPIKTLIDEEASIFNIYNKEVNQMIIADQTIMSFLSFGIANIKKDSILVIKS